jgi:hypothetical protein
MEFITIDCSNLALIVRQIATADFPQDYLTQKMVEYYSYREIDSTSK